MYPSEYAYRDDSDTRAESGSANCRRYLAGPTDSKQYIHCNGTRLKLADSNFGQEQYGSSEYYVWIAGKDGQLLFIFSTRVSLTTITLHYYSDSVRGLSRLRFYAVPDDYDIWDAPSTSYPHVDVAAVQPGGEPAGQRNVSVNVNFNTEKVLIDKFSSQFQFAVSEVEFFEYNSKPTLNSISSSFMCLEKTTLMQLKCLLLFIQTQQLHSLQICLQQ